MRLLHPHVRARVDREPRRPPRRMRRLSGWRLHRPGPAVPTVPGDDRGSRTLDARGPGPDAARSAAAARRARPGPAGRTLRRRPCRHHDLLRARRRLRLPAAVGAAALDGGADGLPRPRGATGRGHRPGSDRPHPAPLRRRGRGRCPGGARGGQPGHRRRRSSPASRPGAELLGVSRYVAVPVAAVLVSLAGPRRQLPPRRARADGTGSGVRRLRRGRRARPSGLVGRLERAGRRRGCRSATRRR